MRNMAPPIVRGLLVGSLVLRATVGAAAPLPSERRSRAEDMPPAQVTGGIDDLCGDATCGGLHLLSLRVEAHRQPKPAGSSPSQEPAAPRSPAVLSAQPPPLPPLPPLPPPPLPPVIAPPALPPGVQLPPPLPPLPWPVPGVPTAPLAAAPAPRPTSGFMLPFAIVLVLSLIVGANLALRDAQACRNALGARGWGTPSPPKDIHPLPEYILVPSGGREVVAETFGTFLATFASNMLAWTGIFNTNVLPQMINGAHGIPPAPLKLPSTLYISFSTGLIYAVTFQVAPGCTLNPLFSLLLLVGGVRSAALSAMCISGQFVGMLAAHALTFALLRTPLMSIAELSQSGDYRTLDNAQIFGVMLPPEWFPNHEYFVFTMLGSALLVIIMFPNFAIRYKGEPPLHPAMERLIVAIGIMLVTGVLFQTGLGGPPNPFAALPAAVVLSAAGWPQELWTGHGHCIWVSVFAPVVGFVLGLIVNSLYLLMMLDEAPRDPPAAPKAGEAVGGEAARQAADAER